MKNRLINNRLKDKQLLDAAVAQTPKHCLIRTGLSFDGVEVVLSVPIPYHKAPPNVAAEFNRDWAKMYKRSKMTTLHDMYNHVFRSLADDN